MRQYLLALTLIALPAFAKIASTEITGLYNAVSNNKKNLSPVRGFNWFEVGIIENMYRFGDQESPTIKLVRELFYLQPDDVTFDVTYSPGKPASYFTAQTIGKILNLIDQNPEKVADADLTNLIREALPEGLLKLQSALAAIAELNTQVDALEKEVSRLKKNDKLPEAEIKQTEIQGKKEILARLESAIPGGAKKAKSTLESMLKEIRTIVKAIQGSLEETAKEIYVPNTTQQILLSFLWKKANEKQEFVDYFNQFSPSIVNGDAAEILKLPPYTKEQYENFFMQIKHADKTEGVAGTSINYSLNKKNISDLLLNDYELSSYASQSQKIFNNKSLPPLVGTIGNSLYKEKSFSNCGEASIRDFFDIIMYNSANSKIDIEILKQIAQKNKLTLHPSLVTYFEIYNKLPFLGTTAYHNAWNDVVSNIPGVEYNNRTADGSEYNISSRSGGLQNVLRILNYLLLGNSKEFALMPIPDQLDFLIPKLSHEGFNLTWEKQKLAGLEFEAAQDEWEIVKLIFNVNEQPDFDWNFAKKHFVMEESKTRQTQRIKKVVTFPLTEMLIKSENATQNCNTLDLLGWYFTLYNETNMKELQLQQLKNIFPCYSFMLVMTLKPTESIPFLLSIPLSPFLQSITKNLIGIWQQFSDIFLASIVTTIIKQKIQFLYEFVEKIPAENLYNGYTVVETILRTQAKQWYPLAQEILEKSPRMPITIIVPIFELQLKDWYGQAQALVLKQKNAENLCYVLEALEKLPYSNELKSCIALIQTEIKNITKDYLLMPFSDSSGHEAFVTIKNSLEELYPRLRIFINDTKSNPETRYLLDSFIEHILMLKITPLYDIVSDFIQTADEDAINRISDEVRNQNIDALIPLIDKRLKELGKESAEKSVAFLNHLIMPFSIQALPNIITDWILQTELL